MVTGRAGPAITVDQLRKTYGSAVAADDVSFSVAEHEIFGIIGPNGAGKTTTVECVSGLRVPDSGTIRVLGLDPQRDRGTMRECVGVQLQEGALRSKLTAFELVDLFASFYAHPADPGALLDMLGLAAKRNDYYNQRAAAAIGTVLLYLLLFFAGLWTPRQTMSATMLHISNFTPLGAGVQAMQSSMQGTFPAAQPLLVMAAYAVVLGFAAVRLFRWE
jgi:ABC-type transport system involved in cytochrome c biogenesis ATPase subunit